MDAEKAKKRRRFSKDRCPSCSMPRYLCMCSAIQRISTETRLCLIIQDKEVPKPSNTGVLAHSCLINSELHIRGKRNAPVNYGSLIEPQYENIFLYLSKTAKPLQEGNANAFTKPVKLFVADGNWGQAARIHRKCVAATGMATYSFPVGEPSEYRLREEPAHTRDSGLATIEAIARAYSLLGEQQAAEAMLHVFRIRVDRLLFDQSKMPANKVYGGLPPSVERPT
jgi:DTW domain-containing protein